MKLDINKVLINGIRASSLLFLMAGNAFAAANASSTDVVGNLGFFSDIAGTIMMYSNYIAFFMAIMSLLTLWVSGMLAKVSKIEIIQSQKAAYAKALELGHLYLKLPEKVKTTFLCKGFLLLSSILLSRLFLWEALQVQQFLFLHKCL